MIIPTDYIKFDPKPDAVPYKYRLGYRISLISLILKFTSGKSGCSLTKINLITISMYSNKGMQQMLAYLENPTSNYLILRFDPGVNKTINFMIADDIIYQQGNGLFRLTQKGKVFVNNLIKDKNLLISEKQFLQKISTNLSEDRIKEITKTLLG